MQNYIKRMSGAISWLRFPLIIFVILLHCSSVSKLEGNHLFFYHALYPFSLWLGETGVPCFFFISGYLFFHSSKTYKQKLLTRIHTLLIPYLLWNGIILGLYIMAFTLGYPQDIHGKNISEFTFFDYIRIFWDRGHYDQGNFVPLLCPLWYIRNLMIMCIISPIIYYIIKYGRELFLLIITIWWLYTFDNAFIPQTILFFSIGAYFTVHNINPLKLATDNYIVFISLFLIFAFADISSHIFYSSTHQLQLHRLSIIFNIPILFLIADKCERHGYSNAFLSDSTFIVFCCHYPITIILRKYITYNYSYLSDYTHILLYFICVIISILLSLTIYFVLNKYLPRTKILLSGNR